MLKCIKILPVFQPAYLRVKSLNSDLFGNIFWVPHISWDTPPHKHKYDNYTLGFLRHSKYVILVPQKRASGIQTTPFDGVMIYVTTSGFFGLNILLAHLSQPEIYYSLEARAALT